MKNVKTSLRLAVLFSVCCLSLCACGASRSGEKQNNPSADTQTDSITGRTGNAVEDVADGVGDAAKDLVDGTGDAVDDLMGNGGFKNYSDAHDYFMDSMSAYHSDAKFELRNEEKELSDYQEGSKGYHFYLYDTSKKAEGELFGEFYVDATSGTIYRRKEDQSFEEYPAGRTGATGVGTGATGTQTDSSEGEAITNSTSDSKQ